MPENKIINPVPQPEGMKYYIIRPDMFVQGKDEDQAWQALSMALGTKITTLKYWFKLVETTFDPNSPGN